MEDDNSTVQTVEIIKRPGQSLGFYIREGNGRDRWDGVFISRLAVGSVADQNGLLRVGDEILSVNNVDVSSRRLEDVVISMSIPKRLVLTVRTQNASACSETTSSSSLSALAAEEDEPSQPPVVVVKGGRCGGAGGGSSDLGSKDRTKHRSPEKQQRLTNDDIERGMRPYVRSASTSSSNRCQDARTANHDGMAGGRISRHHAHQQQQMSYHFQHGGRDDSSDSGLSSENSRFFQQSTEPRGPPRRYGSLGSQSDGATELYENIRNLQNHVDEVSRQRDQLEGRNRTFGTTCRSTPIQLDYSSDPDSGYPQNRLGLERLMSRYTSAKGTATRNNTLSFPERLDWVKNKYDGVGNSKRKYAVEYATLGRRFSQADQYEAELELRSAPGVASHSLSKERPLSARDRYITQLMMSTGDRCTPPGGGQYGNGGLEEVPDGPNWKGWLQRGLENLSLNQINNINSFPVPDDLAMSLPGNNAPNYGTSLHKDPHDSDAGCNWSTSPTNSTSKLETVPRAIAPNHQRRLTRKLSADSLFDYKTYQMEEPVNSYMEPTADAGARRAPETGNVAPKVAVSGGPGLFMPFSTMTLSRAPSRHTATVVTGSTTRDHHLVKAPLQIRKEAFKHYQALPANEAEVGISGQISCHVFCGHGLVSSRAVLQDLYCVIELDTLGCARTTVHTGAMNFDWDDTFEIDLYNARTMSFLIYSWDPYGRHRLSFSCVIALSSLVQQAARQRLAIKMDPKGILYTELVYRDPRSVFHRTPSVHANAFFGVSLQAIVDREKTGTNVPILVHRCIEEVEKRGLDQVGLYRLCGSAKRKQHLREELERNPWTADLSTESVGDINIITVTLKDFLRELPEPLCTTALHQMLMDALSVQLPGDVEGNAMLVLTIMECWPKVNQETLAAVLNHLRQVSLKADVNKMSIANLAICFGPILLCPGSQANLPQGQTWNFSKHIELLKYILDIWPHIRDKLGKPAERGGGQMVARSSTGHSSHLHRSNHVE